MMTVGKEQKNVTLMKPSFGMRRIELDCQSVAHFAVENMTAILFSFIMLCNPVSFPTQNRQTQHIHPHRHSSSAPSVFAARILSASISFSVSTVAACSRRGSQRKKDEHIDEKRFANMPHGEPQEAKQEEKWRQSGSSCTVYSQVLFVGL